MRRVPFSSILSDRGAREGGGRISDGLGRMNGTREYTARPGDESSFISGARREEEKGKKSTHREKEGPRQRDSESSDFF